MTHKKEYQSLEALLRLITQVEIMTRKINMLAANALVEAARVGDKSKNFSVIATEFKKLSVSYTEIARELRTIRKQIEVWENGDADTL